MKITDIEGLWVGYSKEDDFRILIAAEEEIFAEIAAKKYCEDSGLSGEMTVEELTSDNIDLCFDCDYIVIRD